MRMTFWGPVGGTLRLMIKAGYCVRLSSMNQACACATVNSMQRMPDVSGLTPPMYAA